MATGSIATQLLDSERMGWTGGPGTGIRLQAMDAVLIPFSLLWWRLRFLLGVFGYFDGPRALHHAPLGHSLRPGRPLLRRWPFHSGRWLRGRTSYAVTNQRVLIYRPAPFGRFTTLSPEAASRDEFDRSRQRTGHNPLRIPILGVPTWQRIWGPDAVARSHPTNSYRLPTPAPCSVNCNRRYATPDHQSSDGRPSCSWIADRKPERAGYSAA